MVRYSMQSNQRIFAKSYIELYSNYKQFKKAIAMAFSPLNCSNVYYNALFSVSITEINVLDPSMVYQQRFQSDNNIIKCETSGIHI